MKKLAKHPWLTQRGNVFYVRAPVPKDIVNTFGKQEITYSLKTTDRRSARKLITSIAKEISDQFEQHRKLQLNVGQPSDGTLPTYSSLNDPQIQRWCDDHFQRVVDNDFSIRSDLWEKIKADPDGFALDRYIEHPRTTWYLTFYEELSIKERLICCLDAFHKRRLRDIEDALAVGDYTAVAEIAEQFEASSGPFVKADRLRLIRKLMETELSALESVIKKDSRRYDEISKQCVAVAQNVSIHAASNLAPGALLSSFLPSFLEEGKRQGLVKKTILSDATDMKEFVLVAGDKPIRSYTPADGTKYKDCLLALPAQRQVAPFKGLDFAQSAVKAEQLDPERTRIPRLHVDTINDKLMVVRKFFRWLENREKNVSSPVEGLRIKTTRRRGKQTRKRYPFTAGELQIIFNGPIFTGCKSQREWKVPGDFVPRLSAQFWVPLIGLFTGMRLGEIIQMRVADVKSADGITYFEVSETLGADDDDAEKSLKNFNSAREVPVHPTLFAIGFQEFFERRIKDGSTRMFREFQISPTDDSWSKTFSAWFRRYRQHVGVERIIGGKNRVDFHSFRHNFEDAVRDIPGVKKEWRDALQGHGEGGSSQDYGLGVRLPRLHDALQKVQFPGLDLAHLLNHVPADYPITDNTNGPLP